MTPTKPDGSPAPKYLRVTRTWTYNVDEAAESLAEFVDGPISWDDVYQLILGWIPEDVRQPVGENLPAIEEVYDVSEVTPQKPNDRA